MVSCLPSGNISRTGGMPSARARITTSAAVTESLGRFPVSLTPTAGLTSRVLRFLGELLVLIPRSSLYRRTSWATMRVSRWPLGLCDPDTVVRLVDMLQSTALLGAL